MGEVYQRSPRAARPTLIVGHQPRSGWPPALQGDAGYTFGRIYVAS